VTVEVSILCPASMGGTACEVEALRATEVLRWAGAVCIQNGCTYDGISQVYVVSILATFTGITGEDSFEKGPGFEVRIGGIYQPYATSFSSEEVQDRQAEYVMGENSPVGISQGPYLWKITLEELIPAVTTGYGKLAEVEVSGNIQKALKAENEVGFAYIMTEGEASYLAVVNAMGVCKIYNVEGADVTADHAALATEAKAHAAGKQTAFGDKLSTKLAEMMSGAADITLLELESFNTVAVAASFTVEGATYYGFYSRSIGWDSRIMNIFVIIDENGAIAKTTMTEFVFEEHDFVEYGGFAGVPGNYLESFVGITQGSDTPVIAGATMSSNAIKQSTTDAFAAFKTINKGGEQ
jgi:hypothetical protein